MSSVEEAADLIGTDLLGTEDAGRQLALARALGHLGDQIGPAVPALVGLLEGPDPRVRDAAARALSNAGKDGLGPLVESLAKEPAALRARAARVLGLLGPEGKPAVASLTRLLQDSDPSPRLRAAEAIGFTERGTQCRSSSSLAGSFGNFPCGSAWYQ